MSWPIVTTVIAREGDVVLARQRARAVAELLGFERQDQTRIATAVSEIARNAYGYAGGGRVEFLLDGESAPQALVVRVTDRGRGIADLETILDGNYRSTTGMGLGITGARRLVDRFRIETAAGAGTTVELGKTLPKRSAPLVKATLGDIAARLARERAFDPLAALAEQNLELVDSLNELRARQDELARLNVELEDTNRGVVALYSELDEKAEQLRRASEMKSAFLSNMSHEFRTPLSSIVALSRLLLDGDDGELTAEQERQVGYIVQSAESLTDLVNDLLDLAKVEAGKLDLHPGEFTVSELFGGLRGALRPLKRIGGVDLVFEEPVDGSPLHTDEGKVAQILRNFIANALKFTEQGEVRVTASTLDGRVAFRVRDTGIGIAEADRERIFDEFSQIESPLQGRSKGTGLGLPLSRRLAHLLGGEVAVESTPGQGSTFTLVIPADLETAPTRILAEEGVR